MAFARKLLLKRFTKSSLLIAFIFSINAFLLFFLEQKLEDDLRKYEGQVAVMNAMNLEKDFVDNLVSEGDDCKINPPTNCSNYAANVLRYENRLNDLIIVFTSDPFRLPSGDPLILSLGETKASINYMLENVFNHGKNQALSLGINTPDKYGDYISGLEIDHPEDVNPGIDKLSQSLLQNLYTVSAWSKDKLYYLPEIERDLLSLQLLLKIIFITQILVYLAASFVDYWLNNLSAPYSVLSPSRFARFNIFKTKRSRPLFMAIFTGLITIVVSQLILDHEIDKMIATNCRTINRNSIAFGNSAIDSLYLKSQIYTDIPNYCNQFLSDKARKDLANLKQSSSIEKINSEQLRIYADTFSSIEVNQMKYSRNLALILIAGNVLTISFQLLKLEIENEEV